MEQNIYQEILNNLYDGVYCVDINRKITFWNKGAERITEYSSADIEGHSCADNILCHIDESGKELCIAGCPLSASMADGRTHETNVYLHHKLGHRLPVSVRVTPVKNPEGVITGAIEIFTDISNRTDTIRELEILEKEVYTDTLTICGNKRYADITIRHRLNELKTAAVPFGMLFIDIDHFKKFNDTFGHNIGDEVLKAVTLTTENLLRNIDTLCRWGGEEFIVIIPNVSYQVLNGIAERIRIFISHSFIMGIDVKLAVTASIGGTMARVEDTAEELIARADAHMYRSKNNGRNRVSMD